MTTSQETHTTEYTTKAAAQEAAAFTDLSANVIDLYRQGASWYVVVTEFTG